MAYNCRSCYGTNNNTNYLSISTYNPNLLLSNLSKLTHNKYELNNNLFNTDITDILKNYRTNTTLINQDKTPQFDNIKYEIKPIPTKQSYAFKMYI